MTKAYALSSAYLELEGLVSPDWLPGVETVKR